MVTTAGEVVGDQRLDRAGAEHPPAQRRWVEQDGLKLIAQGKEINYEGASGPCDFNEIGDIISCRFRYTQVKKGKLEFQKIV